MAPRTAAPTPQGPLSVEPEPQTAASQPDTLATAPPGRPGCDPASPLRPWKPGGLTETKLTPDGLQGWALLWEHPPWDVDEEVKVVVRLTGGSGTLEAVAVGPHGTGVDPAWGPSRHEGSNYERRGNEWGLGFRLSSEGCWELRMERGSDRASIWLSVEQSAA